MNWITRAGMALVVGAVAVGCSSEVTGSPASPSAEPGSQESTAEASGECATVDAPMLEIPAKADGEPEMAIPAPAGWERSTKMDSELIRFALVNPSLVSNDFAPNVVVTLEEAPGEQSPDSVFEQQRKGLVEMGGALDLKTTPGELCGEQSETVDYTGAAVGAAPARPITVLLSSLQSGGTTYAVAVTIQTLDPQNPTFQQDRDTILEGFRFLAPAS